MNDVISLFEPGQTRPATPAKRPLPMSERAERSLLGAILQNNVCIEQVISRLNPDHFSSVLNGQIYAELGRRILVNKTGSRVDVTSMIGWVESCRAFGPHNVKTNSATIFLSGLVSSVTSHYIAQYGDQIIECWMRRRTIKEGEILLDAAYDQTIPLHERIAEFPDKLDKIVQGASGDKGEMVTFDQALESAVVQAREAKARGGPGGLVVPTMPRISRAIPMLPKEFTILGGIAGSGKSALGWAFVIEIARAMRETGRPIQETGGIVGFSFEMSEAALGMRALSAASGVPVEDMIRGAISQPQMEAIERSQAELSHLPVRLLAIGGLSPSMIKQRFIQALRFFKGKIALAIIDHVNLVDAGEASAFATGRVADALLGLGKEFGCHLLGLCQLTLGEMRRRKDPRPNMGDLRMSGNWAQNADNILLLHRQIQWEPKAPPLRNEDEPPDRWQERIREWQTRQRELEGIGELIVEKVRNGRAGFTIKMLFDGKTTSYSEDPSQPL